MLRNGLGNLLQQSTRLLRGGPVQTTTPLPDKLFKSIELEMRGHDPAVLRSYTTFLKTVCGHLNIPQGRLQVLPYVRWIQYALRSKFVHKKYKLHYETRTHITKFEVKELTGSTASTFFGIHSTEYPGRRCDESRI
ncbi:unnamed protein product, partial [Mesorhabditis belari]|uniref:Small ribosomal subunit protein uS10m n=1 Tax=Mesorhabditis belari TaxID=2138241 RepID=A0AAF3FNW8_9BILA